MREKSSYPDNSCWCSGLLSRILQILTIFLLPQYLSADAWTGPREKRHNFTFAVRGGVATSARPRLHPLLQGPEGRWGHVKATFSLCGTLWRSTVPVGSGLAGRTSERAPAPEVQVGFPHKTPGHSRRDRTPSSHRPEAFNVTLQSRRLFKSMNFNCMSLNYKQHMIFFCLKNFWTAHQSIATLY